jgi:TusA-related sulfurtransferase
VTANSLPEPDDVFDGGSMDCGSGLILLIRQHMLQVPQGGVLEIRSSEPTVTGELPPWCRMVGHEYLETTEVSRGQWRHFVRRGSGQEQEDSSLDRDRKQAREFQWRARARSSSPGETTVYSRSFSWKLGQVLSFEENDSLPTSMEAFLGAVLGEVVDGFAVRCGRSSIVVDDLEANIQSTLNNVLAQLDMEDGDPSLNSLSVTAFVSSPAHASALRQVWEETLRRSPVWQTLCKSCKAEARLVTV